MSRTWWVSLFGLLLGAILFGIVQRGCSSAVDARRESGVRESAAEFRERMIASASASAEGGPGVIERLKLEGQRYDQNYLYGPSGRSTSASSLRAPATPDAAAERAQRIRDGVKSTPASTREAIERRNRQLAAQGRTTSPEFDKRVATTTGRLFGGAMPASVNERAAAARREFLDGVDRNARKRGRDPRVPDSAKDDSSKLAEKDAGDARKGDRSDQGSGESGGGGGDALSNAIQQALGRNILDPSLRATINNALANLNNGATGSRPGGAVVTSGRPPAISSGTGGTGSNGGQGATGGTSPGAGSGGTIGGVGSGGTSGGRDTTTPPPPPVIPVLATWVAAPVRTEGDLANFRSADLYLSFSNPARVLVLTSTPQLGIRIDGGSLYQDTSVFGSNGPATADILDYAPQVGADSFLTLGGQTPVFPPGLEPNRDDWGAALNATWFTLTGAAAVQDRARFGDDRWHVWVGRFTAGGARVQVSGALIVNYIDMTTGAPQAMVAPVLNCANCWNGASGQITPADLQDVSLLASGVPGGTNATGVVTLARPAPPGGTLLTLVSTDPAIAHVGASVRVRQGETSASFPIETKAVAKQKKIGIAVSDGRTQRRVDLTVHPIGVTSIVFSPAKTLPGRSVTATITLNAPATEGLVAYLAAANQALLDAPARVALRAGQATTTFTFKVRSPAPPQEMYMLAAVFGDGERGAFGSFTIDRIPADLNADGIVNSDDMAQLLGSWGACASSTCAADLNGDGLVNAADSAILLGSWGDGSQGGQNPGGGTGGGGTPQPGVIARWIPVDNSSCPDTAGTQRTVDLYLTFENLSTALVVDSNATNGIKIANGSFYQARFGSNAPPNSELLAEFPCLAFDSYFALEGDRSATLNFTPGSVGASNWGSSVIAGWFTTSLSGPGGVPGVNSIQDESRFGDDRHYLRVARLTAPSAASVSGSIEVSFIDRTLNQTFAAKVVALPDWTLARGALDLNGDGAVDAADVAIVAGAMGRSAGASGADINGDGVVTTEDLSLVVQAASVGAR